MATITANAGTFAHTNTAAWVGGVVPGVGDDVVIPSGSTVNVATATTWTIGATGTPTAYCLTVNGTLNITGTVRLNSYAKFGTSGAGVVQVNATGVLESNNTGTALIFYTENGTVRLRGTGVGANRATIRNGSGAAGFRLTRFDPGFGCYLDSEWGKFLNLTQLAATVRYGQGSLRLIDTLLDTVTFDTNGSNWEAEGSIEIRRMQQINSPNANCFTIGGNAGPASGAVTRIIEDAAFDRIATINQDGYTILDRIIFGEKPLGGTFTTNASGMRDCVFYTTDRANLNMQSSLLRGFCVLNNPAQPNWHGFGWNTVAGSYTVDGIIFDGISSGEDGDAMAYALDGVSLTVRNVLGTKASSSTGGYGKMVSHGGTAGSSTPVIENCTWYTADNAEGCMVGVGESYATRAGMIGAVRNNLAIGVVASAGKMISRFATGAAANIRDTVNSANLTNNCVVNAVAGGTGIGTGNATVAGGDGVMFASTPAAPLTAAPALVDDTRNLSTWYRSVVGGTAGTRTADLALAVQAMASQWGDSPVAGATITAAWDWIRAGYAPTNTALRTNVSANNGGWIGAVAGVSSLSGPTTRRRRLMMS